MSTVQQIAAGVPVRSAQVLGQGPRHAMDETETDPTVYTVLRLLGSHPPALTRPRRLGRQPGQYRRLVTPRA